MTRVHVIANRRALIFRHVHPLRVFSRELESAGFEVRVFHSLHARDLDQCDVLLFMEGDYRDLLPTKNATRAQAVDFLSEFLTRFRRVVWFDTHDSSGMLRSYVFPLIEGYAKAQLLKNASYYNEPHLTGVPFRDYVYERHGLEDEEIYKGPVGDGIEKLRLGWNLALMDWAAMFRSGVRNRLRRYSPTRRFDPLAEAND